VNVLKSITLRLPEQEYLAFDLVCAERGYSKTGKIREFIRNLVQTELDSVKVSAGEWRRIQAGIAEIEQGRCSSLEDLKRSYAARKVVHPKNRRER